MNGDFVSLIEKERAILDRYSLNVWQERDRIIIKQGWESGNSVSSDLRGNTTQGNLFPLEY
jgi:hypothetical protein